MRFVNYRTRLASAVLTVAVLATGALAAWSFASGGSKVAGEPALPPPLTVTPTPALLSSVPPIDRARQEVATADPAVASLLDAAARADVSALIAALPVVEGPCDQFAVRGVTRCESAGLPAGTVVKLYETASESLPGFTVDEATARATVGYLLAGRNPGLDLLARRPDGSYLAVIGVDPQPDRLFPGGTIVGGDVGMVSLVVGKSGRLLDFTARSAAAPPLEPIRNSLRRGDQSYTILGVSDRFAAQEAAAAAAKDALNKQSPP